MSAATVLGDWGSTRLRLWLMAGERIVDHTEGAGIIGLASPPADELRRALTPWLAGNPPARITLCGMAGARGGLREAGYLSCPALPRDLAGALARFELDGLPVRIIPGCATADDVMRGEETQAFGAMAREPALAEGQHLLVLPGTHSKWIELDEGRIARFRTFPTGELYALLQRSSLLALPDDTPTGDEVTGFAEGIDSALAGGGLLGRLFGIRARQLLDGLSRGWAQGQLSGLLLGHEIAEALAGDKPRDRITVIGDASLAVRYVAALARFGVAATTIDGDACVLAGLEAIDAHAE
jgi:2-dehydro-3-deoxygalactonokinase